MNHEIFHESFQSEQISKISKAQKGTEDKATVLTLINKEWQNINS